MLKLDQTTRKLQAVLSGAVTTNQLPCMVSYSDDNGTTYVGGTQLTNTNSTTVVDICAAPGASTVRDIDYLSIRNRDTAAATVTVMLDDNGTDYEIVKAALAVGDQLTYTHGDGWRVIDADGNLKTGGSSGTGDVVGPASATANSLARFDGTTGKLLKDGAVIGTDVASLAANTFTGLQTWKASADIASAATVDLTAATGNTTRITGTTATSAFTMTAGQWHMCVADGAWPLTYHATTNKLNTGGVDYTCAAGDRVLLHKDGSGVIQATIYTTSGKAVSAGKLVQRVEATPYTTWSTTTTAIPNDDTIPQNTEGSEYVTVTITPKSASNRLVIEACASALSADGLRTVTGAIYQDSTANALAAAQITITAANYMAPLSVRHEMAAGTTSATTFKFRLGTAAGGTASINGNTSGRTLGGVNSVRISVTEIAP